MRSNKLKAILKKAALATTGLLLGVGMAAAQQTINLVAGPAAATMPDGSMVPMWGYSCGSAVAGSTATCAQLNNSGPGWSPVVITVPYVSTGTSLTINLTNNLSFTTGSGTNTVPTSLTIVGQVGGGLGTPTSVASPPHADLTVTWPTAGAPGSFVPPQQGPRVQSFATEVAAGATTPLTWSALRPGTYLLESGTHPSIQGPMGLYGIVVVTTPPTATTTSESAAGTAYPGVTYDADVPVLLSEIDPVQNKAVQAAVMAAGFSETRVWSGQPGGCGNPASTGPAGYQTCYPPAVNYTPLYYMINGAAFNKTNANASLFSVSNFIASPPATQTPTGTVLVRFVNAGVHMHVPSISGSLTGTANASGFSIIAEDGHPLPGNPRVQHEVFMAAGKTYDVMINAPAAGATAVPVYDRELSLSGNATARDAGMLAYISVNGSKLPAAGAISPAVARADTYPSLVAGQTLTVSDPSKGVIANDTNVYGVQILTPPANGTVTLNANGTFAYVPGGNATSDSFVYCANGTISGTTCSSGVTATVTLSKATIEAASGITVNPITYTSNLSTYIKIPPSGVLSVDKDAGGFPLSVVASSVSGLTGPGTGTVNMDANGGFNASVSAPGTYFFTYKAQNSQGTTSTSTSTVTLIFPQPSNLQVTVVDGTSRQPLSGQDYRWIIEEDTTFYVDPKCTTNPPPSGCPTAGAIVPTFSVNFATSHVPFVAQGCTGPKSCEAGQTQLGKPVVCDIGNGNCRPDTTGNGQTAVLPSQVVLDPTKRYYISVLPGDAGDPFAAGYAGAGCTNGTTTATGNPAGATCGHGMGGAPIPFACPPSSGTACSPTASFAPVTVLVEPGPYPPGKLSVNVFEDDFPLNGEQDAGGGVDVLATNEPGLGGFNLELVDQAGRFGDVTGQMTYDMFNQPLSNSLAGQIDAATGLDACPISKQDTAAGQTGITGQIVTCPKYESDGKTLSPLAGQAVIDNLMPGFFSVIATPGADRIARGEEWLQTNTLDGQKAHDAFIKIGEPAYFQEYGPAGYHDTIGFANPAIINGRKAGVCAGTDLNVTGSSCINTLSGKITGERLSRTPDERLYSSGSHDTYAFSQCYVSFGDPDGEDFAFAKCNDDGTFTLTGLPSGQWRLTVFDRWNDQILDGLSTPVFLGSATSPCPGAGSSQYNCNLGDVAEQQWQQNVYTRTFVDDNRDGVSQSKEAGIPLVNTTVRFRDGSLANNQLTDFTGSANFNETFPLFNWYVVETDTTRYKTTGIHTVYDMGGPADGSPACSVPGYPPCGNSVIGKFMANTAEQVSLPTNLRVPGAVYCAGADCVGKSIANGPTSSDPPSSCTTSTGSPAITTCSPLLSTGRIDPPWVVAEGWQAFIGQNNFIEFGKAPYAPGENGGIHGHVIYASTRPFDDPQMLVQTQWEPLVPNVTMNLYKEGFAADGVTPTLTLVDTTQTSSWDSWAQGFRSDGIPNMNCPGQSTADLFYFTLLNQPNYLNTYSAAHGGPAVTPLPDNSQFKCYDGMHNWDQLEPAPYDGMYSFPSIVGIDPKTGEPTGTGSTNGVAGSVPGTNCTICTLDPDSTDAYRYNKMPMLPPGKYVVEVVPPAGYEIVKEEDKNILIGDNFIAPATQEFGGLGNIFILPDQASVASSQQYPGPGYNANNAQNPTQSFGASPENGIVPGFTPEPVWPCVGEARIVPDYISLFPQTKQVSPFAGATRNLCDRKEVTLGDQAGAIAKFYVYTSTHIAAKFTGIITDDFTSEFDPFSPTFGEKFSPPNMPVSFRDWTGAEISRVYSDQWGVFNGLTYSTWEVNPPNPTGYSPSMMITCMNDAGPIPDPNNPGKTIKDPLFNPYYSQFCYENPYMPGATDYMDTPVVPNSAFVSAGYNNPDCAYPDATPAVKEVDGDGVGPWVSAAGKTLTITALGDMSVNNYGYAGPSATTAPFNQKTITRHYGFGSQCTSPTAASTTCNTLSSVSIGGKTATITAWSDSGITVTVPSGVPDCALQQQAQYGGSNAQCGQLQITAGNGKQSIDTVTVTIGGKAPTRLAPGQTIQSALDAAAPGDLIIVPQGYYTELDIMWKPVRLQGVGAASSIIDANTQPAGKLDPWRRRVDCLFGLSVDGQPYTAAGGSNPYDPTNTSACPGTGWNYFAGGPNNPQVDRVPLEGIVGWDTTVNGNLAELLQEPSLLGAYEGAGITVLSKGVNIPAGAANVFGNGSEAEFPTGSTLLTAANCGRGTSGQRGFVANPYPSNFQCNPSSIDGLQVTDSSQGGGGIALHAWAHNMQISNNRINNNAGTLSGGISIGQGEFPDAYLAPNSSVTSPGSCQDSSIANTQLPYCFNLNVNIHNNMVVSNSSTGDELFSSTPAGGGGVTFCTGSDYYKFNYNWVCGNMSTGDGGGVVQLGFAYNGDIEHNTILFNQSTNPTIPTNGGGLLVMGAAPDGNTLVNGVATECGSVTDNDCIPGLSDGAGPGLVINANMLLGNSADSGSGGGLRFQAINGADVPRFPANPERWYGITVTNNIIANNVAGWDGAGVSLEDALKVNLINNTIVSNVTTASSGVLFNTIGAPMASTQAPPPTTTLNGTTSLPQPAGLVAVQNSPQLTSAFTGNITCPANHYAGNTALNGTCRTTSYPYLANDVFWQNDAYYIGVGAMSAAYQQNIVTLYNAFTGSPAASQPSAGAAVANGSGSIVTGGTGACILPGTTGAPSYWDIGVRGDTGPGNHGSGVTLSPMYSVLTDAADYPGLNNLASNPTLVSQYCNGSRTPPEFASGGFQVPPGISDATIPNPIFNLSPAATVDEGNNWINLGWGPLALANPVTGTTLGNFALASGSPAIDYIPNSSPTYSVAPPTDFFGNPRPEYPGSGSIDIGAVEFRGTPPPVFSLAGGTYHSPQTLILTDAIPGATIYYTTNGSKPTTTSTLYTGPITIASSETVEAVAIATGYAISGVSSKAYTYIPESPTAAPVFSLAGGTYYSPQSLILTDSTPGAVIYYTYTTNGTAPTTSSSVYTGPITINKTGTVEAIAIAPNYTQSAASTKAYVYSPEPQSAAPVFSLAGGLYHTPQTLVLSDSTPGATIYYTTNLSTPTTSSTVYTGPLTVASTELVQAVAIAPGYTLSQVSSKFYLYVAQPAAAAPVFSLAGGTYNSPQTLVLTDTTPGATIYYTTNGAVPSTSSTVYSGPITVASSETVAAVAIANGFSLSPVSSKSYNYVPLPQATAPVFSLAGGHYTTPQTLTLTDSTPGATIYYTTNGTTPTTGSTKYVGPITVSTSQTVIAIAAAPNYSNSAASSKAYTIP